LTSQPKRGVEKTPGFSRTPPDAPNHATMNFEQRLRGLNGGYRM
jgi:hypothetical protein